jgi:hypothetical protein
MKVVKNERVLDDGVDGAGIILTLVEFAFGAKVVGAIGFGWAVIGLVK